MSPALRVSCRRCAETPKETTAMWKRLMLFWTLVRTDLRRVWVAWRHPMTPGWFKLGVGLAALYLVSPIDLLPDVIPVLGLTDDLLLVPLALRWLLSRLPGHVQADLGRR
jgi:uncharacterized membrane protein YkvA (DUF1232 family)